MIFLFVLENLIVVIFEVNLRFEYDLFILSVVKQILKSILLFGSEVGVRLFLNQLIVMKLVFGLLILVVVVKLVRLVVRLVIWLKDKCVLLQLSVKDMLMMFLKFWIVIGMQKDFVGFILMLFVVRVRFVVIFVKVMVLGLLLKGIIFLFVLENLIVVILEVNLILEVILLLVVVK